MEALRQDELSSGHRALWILCACGHEATLRWPLDRTTLRKDILPHARCARCRQKNAVDMRVFWQLDAMPMDLAPLTHRERTIPGSLNYSNALCLGRLDHTERTDE